MPQVCPRCQVPVNGRTVRCPECGTPIEAARTPAAPAPVAPIAPLPRPAAEPPVAAPLFVDQPVVAIETPPEPGKRAVVPPPRPGAPLAPPAPPAARPPLFAEPEPEPEPVTAAALAGQGLFEGTSDVQGWMTRMLSGAAEVAIAPEPFLGTEVASRGEPDHLPPPDPPSLFYPAEPDPEADWSNDSFPALPASLATVHAAVAVAGSVEALELLTEELVTEEEARHDAPDAAVPVPTARLEIVDSLGEWADFGPVPAAGCVLGRDSVPDDIPGADALATEHVALRYDGPTLVADDLGGADGVYRRVTGPTLLADGQRFRVGGHVLEFHSAGRLPPIGVLEADDRGTLCTRDLEPLAYVDLVRPSGATGLRFPLTKRDATVIGREGPNACIALVGDPSVSTSHAQVRVRDGGFWLEDLKSRGGTYLQLQGTTRLEPGDVLQAGKLLFRIAEA